MSGDTDEAGGDEGMKEWGGRQELSKRASVMLWKDF